ncbi:MAG: periplasmic heavy metal sensor [Pseudomonadales bacterium]|nr:periplasmic heavy metal sensor [Pseudomonadales bacterium]
MSEQQTMKPARVPAWIKTVLVISVTLNLLFVGAVIGRMMSHPPEHRLPPHLGWMMRGIDETRQAGLKDQLQSYGEAIRPLRNNMRDAVDDFRRIISDPDSQEADMAAALSRMRSANNDYQTRMHDMMLEILVQLAPDQRERVARFLVREHRRPDRERQHDDRPPPPVD